MRKRSKRHFRKTAAFLMAVLLSLLTAGCAESSDKAKTESENTAGQQEEKPALEDDFYEAVNYDLFQEWEIPADQKMQNWFYTVMDQNEERLFQTVSEICEDGEMEVGSDGYNISALYLTGMDKETRDQSGYGTAANAFLEEVEQAQSVEELIKVCLTFEREYGIYSLLGFHYTTDLEDSSQKALNLVAGGIPFEKEIWFSDDEMNQKQVDAFRTYVQSLLKITGLSEEEAATIEQEVTGMMKELAGKSLNQEEMYDPEKTYNVYQASDTEKLFAGTVSMETLEEIFGISPDEKMVVSDVGKTECVVSFLKEENLELLKNYVKVCLLHNLSLYADTESQEAYQLYANTIQGIEERESYEKEIFYSVQYDLPFQLGRLFCERYFTDETKNDIQAIAEQVIAVFKSRLENIEWMSPETRSEAIKKLENIDIRIGYPETWPQDSYELILKRPEEGGLYIDNHMEIQKAAMDLMMQERKEPVDKSEWYVYPQEVNAYYDPSTNSITILVGILQEPFYNPDAKPEENLGGIGAIIGHEITHAFDSSGAQFDEKGNLRNWWTDEDLEHFQELSQKVKDYYDGMEVGGLEVNGELTLIENIADLGGLSCILEMAGQNGYDLKMVMESWARLWAELSRPETLSNQIATDVHSPGKIRANAVLSAMDSFYEVYEIEEGDGMYCAPEERPEIW